MGLRNFSCCGMKELSGISYYPTPLKALENYVGELRSQYRCPKERPYFRTGGAHVVFTQAKGTYTKIPYGDKLKAYIEEQKLGTVMVTSEKKNPNSGNPLKVFVWTIDQRAFRAWVVKHKL